MDPRNKSSPIRSIFIGDDSSASGDYWDDYGDDDILQIDSNRMFSRVIGDYKILQVYCKSKFSVQKYDSMSSFVVSFQCRSIKVVCNVSKFLSYPRQPAPVTCWPLWKFVPIDWSCSSRFRTKLILGTHPHNLLNCRNAQYWLNGVVLHTYRRTKQPRWEKIAQTLLASIFDTLQISARKWTPVQNHAIL